MSYLEKEQLLWEYLTDHDNNIEPFVEEDEILDGDSYLDMETGEIIIGDWHGVKCRIIIEEID
jgi:hypothetical protein